MKNMWKYVLAGLGVVLAEILFVVLFRDFLNGLSEVEAVILAVGTFLAFEMVVCTGLIISKLESKK